MGGTASRSAPMTCDDLPVLWYSKLVRSRRVLNVGKVFFDGLVCNVEILPMCFDKDGLANVLIVSVGVTLDRHLRSFAGTHVSLEILDATGQHTVFHKDSDQEEDRFYMLTMYVRRCELEASSCVCASDTLTIRCTLEKKQQATKRPHLLGILFKPNAVQEPPQVAMDGSHTLTVGSFSELCAALRAEGDGIYSRHFAIGGGSRWYLKFCPKYHGRSFLCLGRGRMAKGEMPMTVEFSFDLKGVVNHRSQKMTHTFDRDNDDFFYDLEQIRRTSPMQDDSLLVRCCLTVVMPEETPIAVPMCSSESVLTPRLSAMHG
ncbi:hypothetical protein CFC21_111635 [Triticum aestivum]|uniref:MATH domain-containing protein n=2 Tax=Triticum aestivum TaxID=4565 RepID=A0A3B6TZA0_WHEAT|nr:hypothetical protein CFC21_111635 [Triticum aestivum]